MSDSGTGGRDCPKPEGKRAKPRVQRCGCCEAMVEDELPFAHPLGSHLCRLLNCAVFPDDGCTLWPRWRGPDGHGTR